MVYLGSAIDVLGFIKLLSQEAKFVIDARRIMEPIIVRNQGLMKPKDLNSRTVL